MKTGRASGLVRLLAAAGLALAMAAAPASGQEPEEDCRCVDADGNEIENCSCFRMPRVSPMAFGYAFADARPRLGVSVSAAQGADSDARGARVAQVLEDGPADDAGIREGDVITRIDGRSLFDPLPDEEEEDLDPDESLPVQRLLAIAGELDPGQEVEIEYLRGDETRSAVVVADDLSDWHGRVGIFGPGWEAQGFGDRGPEHFDELPGFQWQFDEGEGEAPSMLLRRLGALREGLELAELNPELGAYFGVEQGVLVLEVAEDSELGLEPGDVIRRIGDREATSPERVRRILSSYAADEDIKFDVRRDGREMSVSGRRGGA